MKVFDLNTMKTYPYEERDRNVFFQTPEFKARIIELPAGGEMPTCEMESYVVFFVITGATTVTVDQKESLLQAGQCLITEPGTLSMKTEIGVKMLGLQVTKIKNNFIHTQ